MTGLAIFMSIITENDIIVDGMAENAFPFLDCIFEDIGWSLQVVGVRLLMEELNCPRNIAKRLLDAWCIKKDIEWRKQDLFC